MKDDGEKKSGGSRIKSPRDFIEFAQAYYAGDFTNPDREGCGSSERAKYLVRSEILPDEQMRQHLFACSECFVEYRDLVAARAVSEERHGSRWKLALSMSSFRPVHGFAVIALLVLLAGFGLILHRAGSRALQSSDMAAAPEQRIDTASSEVRLDSPSGKEKSFAGVRLADGGKKRRRFSSPDHTLIARVSPGEIKIDLRGDLMRGVESDREHGSFVELARTTFSFRLPDKSGTGSYQVSLRDEFGNEVTSTRAVTRDGRTLKGSLDLRGFAGSRYRLCVSRPNGAPNCYAITIRRKAATR